MPYKEQPHLGQNFEVSVIENPQLSHLNKTSFVNLLKSCIEMYKGLRYLIILNIRGVKWNRLFK